MIDWVFNPLLKMIGFDYKNKRAKDEELLTEILTLLPFDGNSIDLLKNHDMGDPIPFEYFSSLNRVKELWLEPDKEFQVRSLEKLKVKFVTSLSVFLSEYAKKSVGAGEGFISIGIKDWEDRPNMIEYKKNLNHLATVAYQNYCELIKAARKEI